MNSNNKQWLLIALILLGACSSKQQPATEISELAKDSSSATTYIDSTAMGGEGSNMSADGSAMNSTDAVTSATAIANVATFNGTLVIPPQNYATVTLTMAGTVRKTFVLPGAYVRRGAVLATVENPEFIALQQSYLECHAQSEFLEKEYLRQQTLAQSEAASEKKLQQAKADYLSMKSRHDSAAAQLSLLGVPPKLLLTAGIIPLLEVKATISGFVASVKLNLGMHVAAGETLCEIIDKSQTMLRLTAYEKDLSKIKSGDQVEFRVNGLGDKVFHAKLISLGQQVDPVSRSLELYAKVLENDPQFRPGMYVTARVTKK